MEQNFSLTPVHTDKQIQEISNLASVKIGRAHV